MNESQLALLEYTAFATDGFTWYQYHRKFGCPGGEEITSNLTMLLEKLVQLGYLTTAGEQGQFPKYRITESGLMLIKKQQ